MQEIYQYMCDVAGLVNIERKIIRMERYENDPEHMYLMGNLFIAIEPYLPIELNRFRIMQLINVHDQVELYAGDTFYLADQASKEEKRLQERKAAKKLFKNFPHLMKLWEEYEARETMESIIVKKLDIIQAVISIVENKGATWKANKVTKEIEMGFSKWIWERGDFLGHLLTYVFEIAEKNNYFYQDEE